MSADIAALQQRIADLAVRIAAFQASLARNY